MNKNSGASNRHRGTEALCAAGQRLLKLKRVTSKPHLTRESVFGEWDDVLGAHLVGKNESQRICQGGGMPIIRVGGVVPNDTTEGKAPAAKTFWDENGGKC